MSHPSIYVASSEGRAGKSIIAVGIIDALFREFGAVGVFRPIIESDKHDPIADILASQPGVDQSYEEIIGCTYSEIRENSEEAIAKLISKHGAIKEKYPAVVVVGSDYTDFNSANEFAFNAEVAANLNCHVVLVTNAKKLSVKEVVDTSRSMLKEFSELGNTTVAVIANRVHPKLFAETKVALAELDVAMTAAIPDQRILAGPTLAAQFKAVNAELFTGNPDNVNRVSQGVLVAGMTLPNLLPRLFTEATVIVPGDRADLIPGLIMAQKSGSFPQLSGMILVGGYDIPKHLETLIINAGLEMPVARTDLGTYTTAKRLFGLEGAMTDSPRKLEVAKREFKDNVDTDKLLSLISVHGSNVRTPLMFEYQLMEMARRDRKTIVLPEASDDRILQSADILLQRGVADLILLGDANEIKQRQAAMQLSLDSAQIINPNDPELIEKFAAEYAKLRAHKGVTIEKARETLKDLSYFGTMMVHLGMADGMVSGAVNTTANTIRPSLEFIKTRPGVKVVSSSFLMCLKDRVVVYGDCAVNPDPTAEQLADIAISSAETAVAFGIEPRVAMLSYSTGTSGFGADVDKVREATEIVKQRAPELLLEGPIQFDAAVDMDVARTKLPDSKVAGQATVFIFPDLNTGNNTYKAVQRSAGAVAVGPVLQGLNKPVNDLSRGALVKDIVNTVAITAIQAQSIGA